MPPESSKQKQMAKNCFGDELGEDFLSSWKPSKSLAALDFEDDEPLPKNRKSSFSLAKMDTSFDFDFDGGLNALSKFNIDMSDLDLPSSHDKSFRTKDSNNQDKQPSDNRNKKNGEEKFPFQFSGFDELDLDDTFKTKKNPETPVHAKKGKTDFSSHSTAGICHKKGLLDSLSDGGSESTSIPEAGATMHKESHKIWNESVHSEGKQLQSLTFSDDEENSARDLPGTKEEASRNSDSYTPQKRRDSDIKTSATYSVQSTKTFTPAPSQVDDTGDHKTSIDIPCLKKNSDQEVSTAFSAEGKIAVSTSPAQIHKEPDESVDFEKAALSEPDVESNKKSSSDTEVDVSSSECERQESLVDEESLVEESNTRIDVKESPPKENLMSRILEEPSKVESDEHQKSSIINLKPRHQASGHETYFPEEEELPRKQVYEEDAPTMHLHDSFDGPVELDATQPMKSQEEAGGFGRLSAGEPHTVPTEASPTGRPAKRKYSGEGTASDCPSSNQSSSKKLEVEDTCRSAKAQEVSDSSTSLKKCKDLQTRSVEKYQDTTPNPLLARAASKLVAYKSLQGAGSVKKTIVLPSLQSSRPLLGSPEYNSSHQRQSPLVNGKSSATHLQSIKAPQKKPIMLGRLQSSSLPSVSQPNRSLCQPAPVMDISRRVLQERNRLVKEKQLDGVPPRKTSGLASLSKTRAMGALRQSCERTSKFDVTTSKGTYALVFSHARKGVANLKTVGGHDEKHVLENVDAEMADIQNIENLKKISPDKQTMPTNAGECIVANCQNAQTLKEISEKEMVQAEDDGPHQANSVESDDGINEKAEYYAEQLDQLLKDLKNQYEEAMDLRVRAMVINNSFMMLNDPVADEKIRKITSYLREKLCLDVQAPALTQPG